MKIWFVEDSKGNRIHYGSASDIANEYGCSVNIVYSRRNSNNKSHENFFDKSIVDCENVSFRDFLSQELEKASLLEKDKKNSKNKNAKGSKKNNSRKETSTKETHSPTSEGGKSEGSGEE